MMRSISTSKTIIQRNIITKLSIADLYPTNLHAVGLEGTFAYAPDFNSYVEEKAP